MPRTGFQSITVDNATAVVIDSLHTPILTSRAAVIRELVYKEKKRRSKK